MTGPLTARPKRRIETALALLALLAGGRALALPDGLAMGTPIADLRRQFKIERVAPYQYSVGSLKRGIPGFTAYRVVATPVHGLCRIKAWGRAFSSDARGEQARQRFGDVREALSDKYGDPDLVDTLKETSPWVDARDWLLALHAKDRTLAAFWRREEREFPGHVVAVRLEVDAPNEGSVRLSVIYDFENTETCLAWLRARHALLF